MKTENRRRNGEINGGRRKNGRKKTCFSKLRPQKKKEKTEATHSRSGPQIANARAEPESDRKTVEGPMNAGLRRVYGVSSFMKRRQEH